MATKLELAQRALKRLYPELRGDEKTSLKEMVYAIGNARDWVIRADIWARYRDRLEFDVNWDGIIKQYDVLVSYSETRCSYYADLPTYPLDLPLNMGVYLITDCNEISDAYIPVKKSHEWLYGGSFAEDMEGEKMYYQEGNRVFFSSDFNDGDKVNITLIPSGNSIDDDDPDFGVAPDKELDVMNKAVEFYVVQKEIPEDITNNRLSDR